MQVEDEKHLSTSLNTKTSSALPSSQTNLSRRDVVIVLCAVAIWSTTPVFIDQLQTAYQLTPLQISTWRALLVTVFLGLIFLSRTMTVLQWIDLGLIVASVISMRMAVLVQNREIKSILFLIPRDNAEVAL